MRQMPPGIFAEHLTNGLKLREACVRFNLNT